MNFVDIYLTHDGSDTYLTEYYFDSNAESYSGSLIGSFNADISSGLLALKYTNDTVNDVTLKSKIVGFGTTTVGVGTYRFKLDAQDAGQERTVIYQSHYEKTTGAAATTVFTLNKNLFNLYVYYK